MTPKDEGGEFARVEEMAMGDFPTHVTIRGYLLVRSFRRKDKDARWLRDEINAAHRQAVRAEVGKAYQRASDICDKARFYHSGLAQSCEGDSQEEEDMIREDMLADECEELRDEIRSLSQEILKEGKA